MGATGIEWTDVTWNPLTGCAHVSPGCDNCYAAREAAGRLSGHPAYEGLAVRAEGEPARFTGEIRLHPDRLDQPLRWRRPRRVFVNSMSDLFHPQVPLDFIADTWAVMTLAGHHQFQILTKRPQRMADVLTSHEFGSSYDIALTLRAGTRLALNSDILYAPLSNVWLGTSIESDRYAWRADHLRRTPAAVRWVSAEPLLGPLPSLDLTGIDWLVVGGESGPAARPMHPDWVRNLRDRCHPPLVECCPNCGDDANHATAPGPGEPTDEYDCSNPSCGHQFRRPVPAFLFKQAGAVLAREWGCSHRAGGDISEIPSEFHIQEYPQ